MINAAAEDGHHLRIAEGARRGNDGISACDEGAGGEKHRATCAREGIEAEGELFEVLASVVFRVGEVGGIASVGSRAEVNLPPGEDGIADGEGKLLHAGAEAVIHRDDDERHTTLTCGGRDRDGAVGAATAEDDVCKRDQGRI